MLRTIIIGRTEREISNISHQIKEYLGDKLEVIGTSRTIKKGIILIKKDVPDLVILEIYKRKPFKFLEKFKAPYPFEIIITSSDQNNALEAIRLGAFDYMVHPIGGRDLALAIERLEKKWKEFPIAYQNARKELFIPTHHGFVMENRDNILYFEGAINYSRIHLHVGKDYLIAKTLTHIARQPDGMRAYTKLSGFRSFCLCTTDFILVKGRCLMPRVSNNCFNFCSGREHFFTDISCSALL